MGLLKDKALLEIADILIKPALRLKKERDYQCYLAGTKLNPVARDFNQKQLSDETDLEFLERLFHVDSRTIEMYYVKKKFKIPGYLVVNRTTFLKGVGYRTVKCGCAVLVRHDERKPGAYELEIIKGRSVEGEYFLLNRTDWFWVAGKLKRIRNRSIHDDENVQDCKANSWRYAFPKIEPKKRKP